MYVLNKKSLRRLSYVINLGYTNSPVGSDRVMSFSTKIWEELTEAEINLLPTKERVFITAKGVGLIGHLLDYIPKQPIEGVELVLNNLIFTMHHMNERKIVTNMLHDYALDLGYSFLTIEGWNQNR